MQALLAVVSKKSAGRPKLCMRQCRIKPLCSYHYHLGLKSDRRFQRVGQTQFIFLAGNLNNAKLL